MMVLLSVGLVLLMAGVLIVTICFSAALSIMPYISGALISLVICTEVPFAKEIVPDHPFMNYCVILIIVEVIIAALMRIKWIGRATALCFNEIMVGIISMFILDAMKPDSIGYCVFITLVYLVGIENGQDYNEVVSRASESIIAGIENTPEINVEDLTIYDEMKSKLAMEVVSADRNAEMLENVPHEQMEDMAVVYRLILGQDSEGRSSVLVTNDLMEQFGVTHEQLHDDAMISAPEIRPSEIRGMSVVMTEMMGPGMIPEIDPADEQMFVAGVSDNIHGAGVIAYPNFFEDAAEKLGGDFYVLPSSIHEVLLVRDNGEMTAKDLEAIVREVNATQVAPEEQLSVNNYIYLFGGALAS